MITLLHLHLHYSIAITITITITIVISSILSATSHHNLHSDLDNHSHNNSRSSTDPIMSVNDQAHFSPRKLLLLNGCGGRDISISQSKDSIMSSGIPRFIVQIVNTCTSYNDHVYSSGSSSSLIMCVGPSNIHLHCGWFASARMVNPRIFKRLAYDDCILNGGKPLRPNQIISFTYSNSFMYSISFKFAHFC